MDFNQLDMANARIRVLQRVADALPRTADGEIIVPGDIVYRLYDGHTNKGERYICEETVACIWHGGAIETHESSTESDPCSRVFSSREMAEAAVARGTLIKFRPKRRRKRGVA